MVQFEKDRGHVRVEGEGQAVLVVDLVEGRTATLERGSDVRLGRALVWVEGGREGEVHQCTGSIGNSPGRRR